MTLDQRVLYETLFPLSLACLVGSVPWVLCSGLPITMKLSLRSFNINCMNAIWPVFQFRSSYTYLLNLGTVYLGLFWKQSQTNRWKQGSLCLKDCPKCIQDMKMKDNFRLLLTASFVKRQNKPVIEDVTCGRFRTRPGWRRLNWVCVLKWLHQA